MSWKVRRAVVCERCEKVGPFRDRSDDAEKVALAKGWMRGQCYGMALHLCPECVAKGMPDWWPDSTGMAFIWEDTISAD